MKTKRSISPPDFQYAEVSGDIFCPFCKVLLRTKLPDTVPTDDDALVNDADDNPDMGILCNHVGFWCDSEFPSVNETWRKEMFGLAKEITKQIYDGADGYYWQEALNLAIGDEGESGMGICAAKAIPNFQIALCRQFSYEPDTPGQRYMNFMAIIIRKKRTPKVRKPTATRNL